MTQLTPSQAAKRLQRAGALAPARRATMVPDITQQQAEAPIAFLQDRLFEELLQPSHSPQELQIKKATKLRNIDEVIAKKVARQMQQLDLLPFKNLPAYTRLYNEGSTFAVADASIIIEALLDAKSEYAVPAIQKLMSAAGTHVDNEVLTKEVAGNVLRAYQSADTYLQHEAEPVYDGVKKEDQPGFIAAQKLLITRLQAVAAKAALDALGIRLPTVGADRPR